MKLSQPAESSANSPVKSFVLLEQFSAIKHAQTVHASLAALSKVIRGTALITSDVQGLAGALLKQEVSQHTGTTYLTSLPLVSVRHHGHATR